MIGSGRCFIRWYPNVQRTIHQHDGRKGRPNQRLYRYMNKLSPNVFSPIRIMSE